jgi:hypothetical protein
VALLMRVLVNTVERVIQRPVWGSAGHQGNYELVALCPGCVRHRWDYSEHWHTISLTQVDVLMNAWLHHKGAQGVYFCAVHQGEVSGPDWYCPPESAVSAVQAAHLLFSPSRRSAVCQHVVAGWGLDAPLPVPVVPPVIPGPDDSIFTDPALDGILLTEADLAKAFFLSHRGECGGENMKVLSVAPR